MQKSSKKLEKEALFYAKEEHKVFFSDGFELNAQKIYSQVKTQGFCTKAQLEYMILYNQVFDIEKRYHFEDDIIEDTKFLEDSDK